jgi:hypothetical protein
VNLDFGMLWMPASATLTGGIAWAASRGEAMEDGALVRRFVLVLVLVALPLWGIGRSDFVRTRTEPEFKAVKQLAEDPLHDKMRLWSREDAEEMEAFVIARVAAGAAKDEALLQARPMLAAKGAKMVSFADVPARLAWARAVLQALKERQARGAEACYGMLARRPVDTGVPMGGYSAASIAAYHAALGGLYEGARRGNDRPFDPNPPPGISQEEARAAYAPIRERIAGRWGETLERKLQYDRFPFPPEHDAGTVCEARVAQIEAMLELPEPMAARLAGILLR